MKSPEQSLVEAQVDLWSKYVKTQSELLDIKLHLRALLDYPRDDLSTKEMIYMLEAKMTNSKSGKECP